MNEELAEVLKAWDNMENASQRVETSLPFQMSAAIAELELARKIMRNVLQRYTLSARPLPRQEDDGR